MCSSLIKAREFNSLNECVCERETEVEAEGRINPTITNKGKEPIGAAANCPPLGKSE